MPGKNMRKMFYLCCFLLGVTAMAGMLAAICIPAKVSYPERPASEVSAQVQE